MYPYFNKFDQIFNFITKLIKLYFRSSLNARVSLYESRVHIDTFDRRMSRIQQRSSNYNIRRGQGGKVSPGREISSLPRAVAEFLSLPWAVRVPEEMVLIFPAVDSRWPRRISRSRQQADEQPRPPPPRSAEIASA